MQTILHNQTDWFRIAKNTKDFRGWQQEHNPSTRSHSSELGCPKSWVSDRNQHIAVSLLGGCHFHLLVLLLILLPGYSVLGQDAVIPASSARPLSEVLDEDGRLRLEVDGGFDARGYTVSIGSDGSPQFRQATIAQGEGFNEWKNGFFIGPGVGNPGFTVRALAVSGDDIYVGGSMENVGGVTRTNGVARFNRAENRWYALGNGIRGEVNAMAVDNDNVYVGGLYWGTDTVGEEFRYVGRYNKTTDTWHALGSGVMRPNDPHNVQLGVGVVELIDGKVWIGGYFVNAGGIAEADALAIWDTATQTWESVGQIYTINSFGETVVYDVEPYGNGVYVHCYCAFGNNTRRHAIYEDGTWTGLPVISDTETAQFARPIVDGSDLILVRHGDGLMGLPGVPDSTHIARYNGSAYTPMPGTVPYRSVANTLAIIDGELLMGLGTQGGAEHPYLMKHDGAEWVEMGPRLEGFGVSALAKIDGYLWVGGNIASAEGDPQPLNGIARFNGTNWNAVGPSGNGLTGGSGAFTQLSTVALWQGEIYIGGDFEDASGNPDADYIARWTGSAWESVGGGLNRRVHTLLPVGDRLYAAGSFFDVAGISGANRLAQFDGTTWAPLGQGFGNGTPHALAVIGDELYVGGSFYRADGVHYATNLARWDGSQWHALTESGSDDNGSGTVYAMLVDPDGTLIVGGDFSGLYEHNNLARWDPVARDWTAIGPEPNATVRALAFDANGNLVVGGEFSNLGGGDALARWDGTEWQTYGAGLTGLTDYFGVIQPPKVYAIHLVGDNLFVGGDFANAGGLEGTENVAYWDGSDWNSLSTGVDQTVRAIGSDESLLWVGGTFRTTADNATVVSRVGAHPLPGTVDVSPQPMPESETIALKVWPNPTTSGARVQLTLATPAHSEVTVFDAFGRHVATLYRGETGTVELALPQGLSPGMYFIRARSGTSFTTIPVMVIH